MTDRVEYPSNSSYNLSIITQRQCHFFVVHACLPLLPLSGSPWLITINAPSRVVCIKVLDTPGKTRNTFNKLVKYDFFPIEAGDHDPFSRVRFYKGLNRSTKVQLTQENQQLAWRGSGLAVWAMRSTRVQGIVGRGDGRCEHRMWEVMAGPGAVAVSGMMGGKMDEANEWFQADLKKVMERAT